MDGLHQYLKHCNLSPQDTSSILRKLRDEDYDSDSVIDDVLNAQFGQNSNLFLLLANNNQYNHLYKYVYFTKCMYTVYFSLTMFVMLSLL